MDIGGRSALDLAREKVDDALIEAAESRPDFLDDITELMDLFVYDPEGARKIILALLPNERAALGALISLEQLSDMPDDGGEAGEVGLRVGLFLLPDWTHPVEIGSEVFQEIGSQPSINANILRRLGSLGGTARTGYKEPITVLVEGLYSEHGAEATYRDVVGDITRLANLKAHPGAETDADQWLLDLQDKSKVEILSIDNNKVIYKAKGEEKEISIRAIQNKMGTMKKSLS